MTKWHNSAANAILNYVSQSHITGTNAEIMLLKWYPTTVVNKGIKILSAMPYHTCNIKFIAQSVTFIKLNNSDSFHNIAASGIGSHHCYNLKN